MSEQVVRVQVEFYGITRARSGVADVHVDLPTSRATLGTLIQHLGGKFPQLTECFDGTHLRQGFTANIGGERFVTSPDEVVREGDVVLLMSADAGG